MNCNCNNKSNGSEARIKHVYGNVLRLAIPLTLRTVELVNGETVATDTDFIPSSNSPVRVEFSKGSLKLALEATMNGNVAYVEDRGSVPVGTFAITVMCKDNNGNPYRFKQNTVLQVVDATSEAGIEPTIEYEAATWYLDAAIFLASGGMGEEVDPVFMASPAADITAADVANWNNKVDPSSLSTVATSGSYNDLTDKPAIPEGMDLSNYYDKDEVNGLLGDKADAADLSSVATSGSYNDLDNKPDIPSVQDVLDELPIFADVATTGDYGDLTNTPNLATVATSGSYNDLTDKPTIPEGADLTGYATEDYVDNVASGKVDKVTGKGLSTNDYTTAEKTKLAGLSNYDDTSLTTRVVAVESGLQDKANKPIDFNIWFQENFPNGLPETDSAARTLTESEKAALNAITGEETWTIYGVPAVLDQQRRISRSEYAWETIFDGEYLLLGIVKSSAYISVDKYKFITEQHQVVYTENLATVATSGSYNDLTDKPTIPAAYDDTALANRVTALENAGYITTETDPTVPAWAKQPNKPTYTPQEVGALPSSTPIPTSVSDLDNDEGFITSPLHYGTCETAAATMPKVCTVETFPTNVVGGVTHAKEGTVIAVKFTNSDTNTTDAPTLNVNGIGAKAIMYNNAIVTSTAKNTTVAGTAKMIAYYRYDPDLDGGDGAWEYLGKNVDSNTTYSTMSQAEITAGTGTTARTMTPKLLRDNFYTEDEVDAALANKMERAYLKFEYSENNGFTFYDNNNNVLSDSYVRDLLNSNKYVFLLDDGNGVDCVPTLLEEDNWVFCGFLGSDVVEAVLRWNNGALHGSYYYFTLLNDSFPAASITSANITAWNNKSDKATIVTVSTAGAVSQALSPNTFYKFTGALTSLTLTLTAGDGLVVYAGKFTADSSGCTLSLPATVTEAASNDTIEGGKTYEFSILDNVIVIKEV